MTNPTPAPEQKVRRPQGYFDDPSYAELLNQCTTLKRERDELVEALKVSNNALTRIGNYRGWTRDMEKIVNRNHAVRRVYARAIEMAEAG